MRTAVLDIGGTFIKSALYADNMLYQFKETPTPLSSGGKGIVACAAEIVKTYGSFDAIGISTAGQVDPDRGMILYANENIPGYTGTPVRKLLEYIFHVPVVVDNDVNMAAVEVVFHSCFLSHVETELTIHCFKLVTCFIHVSILLQFRPTVKCITSDFFRISLIRFGSAKRIVSEVPD